MNIIIPIGGFGKRFSEEGYNLPKPLIKSLGIPIIFWNIENLRVKEDDIVHVVYRNELKVYNFESLLKNKFRKIKFKFIEIKNDTRGAAETVLYAIQEMSQSELSQITLVVDSDNFYGDDILQICKSEGRNTIFYQKNYDINPIYSYIKIDESGSVIDIKEKEKISDNACVGAYCFESANILQETIKEVIIRGNRIKNEYYISVLYKSLIDNNIPVYSNEIKEFNCLGTPNQLRALSSNLNTESNKIRFCFDLDNTLVTYPEIEGDYTSVKPIQKTIDFLKFIYSQGHIVIIHTARRMKTHGGNLGKVQADIARITLDTLEDFKIPYHEIYFGKPYANFYIDDLSIKPFDNLEKDTGFYNIHPDTRDHNKIEICKDYITKYSESIRGEKYYYENIPDEAKYLFPTLIDSGSNYIKISKIKGVPISFLNSSNALSENLLLKVLDRINYIHSIRPFEDINIYSNYYDKLINRFNSYDFSEYENIEEVKNDILKFLKEYETSNSGLLGIVHGDPVFTNILLDDGDNIKMIDMRGMVGDVLTIHGDIFYDYAKIYQSIVGYDHILMGKDPDPIQTNGNVNLFKNYIINKFGDSKMNDIINLTKSMLLSLIPLHNNNKCQKYYKLLCSL
jgi:capsule biosynthesis phosphatase